MARVVLKKNSMVQMGFLESFLETVCCVVMNAHVMVCANQLFHITIVVEKRCRRIGRFASQGDVVILNVFWTVARNS